MLNAFDFVLVGLAALAAGLVNALAGGGTLISFPMLTAVGVPAVAANVTNTVALCPGYLGATLAQSKDLQEQRQRLWLALPAGALGGIIRIKNPRRIGRGWVHYGDQATRAGAAKVTWNSAPFWLRTSS